MAGGGVAAYKMMVINFMLDKPAVCFLGGGALLHSVRWYQTKTTYNYWFGMIEFQRRMERNQLWTFRKSTEWGGLTSRLSDCLRATWLRDGAWLRQTKTGKPTPQYLKSFLKQTKQSNHRININIYSTNFHSLICLSSLLKTHTLPKCKPLNC